MLGLDFPDPNGNTKREALLHLEAAHGVHDPELDGGQVPPEAHYLWDLFWDIRSALSRELLSMREIEAYCQLTGTRLSPREVGIIRAMDAAATAFYAERMKLPKDAQNV